MRRSLNLVLALSLIVSSASAQSNPKADWPLDSGTKIRVQAAGLGPNFRRGTLTSTTTDSIIVEPPMAGQFSVGLDQISSLQVLRESHTAKAKYTLIGLVVGVAGGAILGAATYSPAKCDPSPGFCVEIFDRSTSTAVGAFVFGVVGGVVGLIAGAFPKETWMPVSIPAR